MKAAEQEFEYDRWGRMKYHPEAHPKHRTPYTIQELAYLCKHYRRGWVQTLAFDLGRTERSIRQRVNQLRKEGLFDYFKKLEI